ncbi:MAG: hypothetical protein M9894_01385 [Planctomycetes bacterium]|nr:hypothetical protein [Planctomycetota bacterium]
MRAQEQLHDTVQVVGIAMGHDHMLDLLDPVSGKRVQYHDSGRGVDKADLPTAEYEAGVAMTHVENKHLARSNGS